MPLHLRRHCEIWPEKRWPDDQHAVITDTGYTIAMIERSEYANKEWWTWSINGDAVNGVANARGRAKTREQAKAEVASAWRAWLAHNGFDEARHAPMFGRQLDEETRRRLGLPV